MCARLGLTVTPWGMSPRFYSFILQTTFPREVGYRKASFLKNNFTHLLFAFGCSGSSLLAGLLSVTGGSPLLVEHSLWTRASGCARAGSGLWRTQLSCSGAWGIFPDQGSNPCRTLHGQVHSYPLYPQEAPESYLSTQVFPWHPWAAACPAHKCTGPLPVRPVRAHLLPRRLVPARRWTSAGGTQGEERPSFWRS